MLRHHIKEILIVVHVVELDDVGVVESPEDVEFGEEGRGGF